MAATSAATNAPWFTHSSVHTASAALPLTLAIASSSCERRVGDSARSELISTPNDDEACGGGVCV